MATYKFTKEQEKEIIEFYLKPNTIEDTSENFNISRTVIKNILDKNNIKVHSKEILNQLHFNKIINGRDQEIINYYLAGNSSEKTAKAFNIGRPAVIKLLMLHNINLRDDSKIIPIEKEQEVIDFYLTPNSLRETCKHFNAKNHDTIKNILKKHNTPMHPQEVCMQLKQQKATKTKLERYGVTNTYQIPAIAAKAQRAWKENEPEIRKKMQQTSLEKYGDPNYHNEEKIKQTRLEKYGVENFFQNKEIHKKALTKASSPEALDKKRQTCLERLGTETPLNNKACREKGFETLYNKYGMYHSPSYNYTYNNVLFDSFPELCFYLYCLNNNIKVQREPIRLPFIFNNKKYYYCPDFSADGQLIEIKGNQFLTEDGKWQNPYDHTIDEQMEAKHQCALANNVKILYNVDYQKYLDWFYANNYKKEDFLIKCED